MDAYDEIKKIYYAATKPTIQKDLERALDLLKTLPTEEERDKVAVFIHGLAQMRSEWRAAARPPLKPTSGPRPPASGRRPAAPPARSDRSKASSRRSR
jgi:hypothetical protein